MRKLMLLVAIILGTSVMASAAVVNKTTMVKKELRNKHPKHRKARKAKMATDATKPDAPQAK